MGYRYWIRLLKRDDSAFVRSALSQLGAYMQSKVINDILTVEDRADSIVSDARKIADEKLSAADEKASEIVRKAIDDEQAQGKQALADAEAKISQSLQTYEEQLDEDSSKESALSDVDADAIAEKIVRRICATVFQSQEGVSK